MTQNLMAMYRKLHEELLSKQALEREKRTRLNDLVQKKSHEQFLSKQSYQEKIDQINAKISDINIYVASAEQYVSVSRYSPVPEQVHPATLQQMYTMLGNSSEGREYAVRLFKKGRNAIKYHENEIENLRKSQKSEDTMLLQQTISGPEATRLNRELEQLKKDFSNIASGPLMQAIAGEIKRRSVLFFSSNKKILSPSVPKATTATLCFGFTFLPFDMGEDYVEKLQSVLGIYYSVKDRTILIPVCFPAEKVGKDGTYHAAKVSITYSDEKTADSHLVVQGLLFNVMRHYVPLANRITYVDLDTFNSEYLGPMKPFVGEDNLILFPSDEKQAQSALRKLENAVSAEQEDRRNRRYLIVRGFHSGSSFGEFGSSLRRICNNTRKNNIAVIFLDRDKGRHSFSTTDKIPSDLNIQTRNDHFVMDYMGQSVRFGLIGPPGGISQQAVQAFLAAYTPKPVTNEYESFYKVGGKIAYTRQRRDIVIPYGVDGRGNALSFKFEGMNFAAFLMGAAGSGKSNLLHVMLTGLIQNYHPDEVELWLADFKLTAFSRYLKHLPPHVRYILMDDAPELVYDFIDLLHKEMIRRESVISGGTEDWKDVPVSKYLPAIFVIIDEFSILAGVVGNNETYRNRLQQLLVKGRALGFRFLFSSQMFSSGAAALTPTAKEQIGCRIVMKNSVEEMKKTLNLPSGQYTNETRHNLETLPKFYTLHKTQEPGGAYRVDKANVFYFPDKDGKEWTSRYALFDGLRSGMRRVAESQYDHRIIAQYVDKHPVIVSRDDLSVFDAKQFHLGAAQYRAAPQNMIYDDDLIVRFGVPRKLSSDLYVTLTGEPGENIFLLINDKETACGMSVILSTARSFISQKANVQVWAYPRNRLYHQYRTTHFAKLDVSEGEEEIRTAIDNLRERMQAKKTSPELIVLLGMENILRVLDDTGDDFGSTVKDVEPLVDVEALQAKTPEEIAAAKDCNDDMKALGELMMKFYEDGMNEGKTEEELDEEFEKVIKPQYYRKKYGTRYNPNVAVQKAAVPQEKINVHEKPVSANKPQKKRNYAKDFQTLVKLGSRYGCHFLVCVNNYNAFKALKLDLTNHFNHRISFKTDVQETSTSIFGNTAAYRLPEHICQYAAFGSSGGSYSVSPYLHKGVTWDNWIIDSNGNAVDIHNT